MPAVVLRGDARSLPLPDGSVDLIVTSPPYYELRSYTDNGQHYDGQIGDEPTPGDYISALLECTREWMRVLKPAGSMWVNLGDKYARTGGVDKKERGGKGDVGNRKAGRQVQRGAEGIPDKSLIGLPWRYAIGCIDRLGLILRAEVIWDKPNGLPESVTDRVRRSHEHWFHLTRQGRYYSAVDEIREPYVPETAARYARGFSGKSTSAGAHRLSVNADYSAAYDANPLGKLPCSVWQIASEPLKVPAHLGVKHFAAFPTEWPRRIIRGWSPPRGLIVDPLGGTGTTALVAAVLGRIGITVDRSADYCRIAAWRTTDPGQIAKAMGVPKPPQPMTGQSDMFADIIP